MNVKSKTKRKSTSVHRFIRENRAKIDAKINETLSPSVRETNRNFGIKVPRFNDNDRHVWLLNNEGLYLWAKAQGIKV